MIDVGEERLEMFDGELRDCAPRQMTASSKSFRQPAVRDLLFVSDWFGHLESNLALIAGILARFRFVCFERAQVFAKNSVPRRDDD